MVGSSRSRNWSILLAVGLALLAGHPANSQTVSKRLAVLEFKGAKIESEVLDAFADAVRGGAVEGLAGRGVQVMTRENMMMLLKEMGKKECSEGDCEVETARNIGADFVVSGSVVKIDDAFVVTLKLHETKEGNLLATNQIDAKKQLDVLRQLRERGRALVANNVWRRSAPPPTAPSRAAEPATTTPAISTPSPPALQSARGCAANQVPIPGGTFWMGDSDLDEDSRPVHKVTLSPYCIDKTEVTVAAFRACAHSGDCPPPSATVEWKDLKPEDKTKQSQYCTWGKGGLDQHPINCVDWYQASAYCAWVGGRLPTEAEWEFAARGSDGRKYSWGDDEPDKTRLNACGSECPSLLKEHLGLDSKAMYPGNDGWAATAPVGSYPKGASPFGALDMAGNVWEWTDDSIGDYGAEPSTNPHRSRRDESPRVLRGGGWNDVDPSRVRAAGRYWNDPSDRVHVLGFRCARGA